MKGFQDTEKVFEKDYLCQICRLILELNSHKKSSNFFWMVSSNKTSCSVVLTLFKNIYLDSCDDAGDGGKIAILPFVCHESCIRILQHIIKAKQRWRSEFTNCIHKKIISTIYTLYIYCFRYLSYLFRTRNERKSVPESDILKM